MHGSSRREIDTYIIDIVDVKRDKVLLARPMQMVQNIYYALLGTMQKKLKKKLKSHIVSARGSIETRKKKKLPIEDKINHSPF